MIDPREVGVGSREWFSEEETVVRTGPATKPQPRVPYRRWRKQPCGALKVPVKGRYWRCYGHGYLIRDGVVVCSAHAVGPNFRTIAPELLR